MPSNGVFRMIENNSNIFDCSRLKDWMPKLNLATFMTFMIVPI